MGIDLNDYEEISQEEWGNLDYRESAMYNIGGKEKFFKKKSKNVFEDEISFLNNFWNRIDLCGINLKDETWLKGVIQGRLDTIEEAKRRRNE